MRKEYDFSKSRKNPYLQKGKTQPTISLNSDIIFEIQDLRYLDWAARKMSPGTPGCFLKAYEEVNGKRL